MSRCSALLVAALVAGAAVAAVAVTRGVAQPAPALAPDMRPGLDDSDNPARPELAKKRRRDTDTRRPGEAPVYGITSGAGKSGFASAKSARRKTKGKAAAKNGASDPLQLFAAPAAPAPAPPPLRPAADSSRKKPTRPGAATGPNAAPPPGSALAAAPANGAAPAGDLVAGAAPPYTLPPRRKPVVELDPFEQVGIRTGAFLVRPAIEVAEGYDTNPARVLGGKGSWFTTVAPELALKSDWQRHELAATIRGSYTAYDSVSSQDRPSLDARINGRIDASERTHIDLEGRYLLATDYAGSPDVPAGVKRLPTYTDVGASVGVTHRFNRFEIALKGTVDRFEYDDAKLVDGSTFSQKYRDYDQYGAVLRGSYEMTPGVKPFVQVDADTRNHDLPTDIFGQDRDSNGFSAKAGTTFEFTRMLTGEIAVGYITRTYKDPTLRDLNGLLVDASLVWAATGLTNVTFTAKTTADESTLFGVSGVLRRNLGLQVDHAFRRWLIGTLRFGYEHDDYEGSVREDKRYTASAALTYKLSRAWQIKGEVREEWLRSNVLGADYNATVALLGLRWQP